METNNSLVFITSDGKEHTVNSKITKMINVQLPQSISFFYYKVSLSN